MIDFNQINWDNTPTQEDLSNVEIRKVMIRDKLLKIRPRTLGQALRIDGVTPAAAIILLTHIKTNKKSAYR